MNAFGRSRTGWALVVAYLVFAALLFGQAAPCKAWLCDLVALPVALPLGLPVAWLIDWIDWMHPIPGHVPSVHLRLIFEAMLNDRRCPTPSASPSPRRSRRRIRVRRHHRHEG